MVGMAVAVARAEVATTVVKVGRRMGCEISLHFIIMAINSQHNQDSSET